MTGVVTGVWAVLGATIGTILTPATGWLAGVEIRRTLLLGITAVAFAVVAWRVATVHELLVLSLFAAVAAQLAVIDALVQRLPRTLIWPSCGTLVCLLVADTANGDEGYERLVRVTAAAAALAVFYLAIAVVTGGGLGAGDIRAAALVGGVLGWHSWTALFVGTMLGFLTTSAGAVLLLTAGQKRTAIPHGPGMLAGAYVALLL